jgi:hypothetical protein
MTLVGSLNCALRPAFSRAPPCSNSFSLAYRLHSTVQILHKQCNLKKLHFQVDEIFFCITINLMIRF